MGSTNKKDLPLPVRNEPCVRIITRGMRLSYADPLAFVKMSVHNRYEPINSQELLVRFVLLRTMGLNSDVSVFITLKMREADVAYSMTKFSHYYERMKCIIEERYLLPRCAWYNDKTIELDPSMDKYMDLLRNNMTTPEWDVHFSITRGNECHTSFYSDDIIEMLILPLFLALKTPQCEWLIIDECPELGETLHELDKSMIQEFNINMIRLGDGRVISYGNIKEPI